MQSQKLRIILYLERTYKELRVIEFSYLQCLNEVPYLQLKCLPTSFTWSSFSNVKVICYFPKKDKSNVFFKGVVAKVTYLKDKILLTAKRDIKESLTERLISTITSNSPMAYHAFFKKNAHPQKALKKWLNFSGQYYLYDPVLEKLDKIIPEKAHDIETLNAKHIYDYHCVKGIGSYVAKTKCTLRCYWYQNISGKVDLSEQLISRLPQHRIETFNGSAFVAKWISEGVLHGSPYTVVESQLNIDPRKTRALQVGNFGEKTLYSYKPQLKIAYNFIQKRTEEIIVFINSAIAEDMNLDLGDIGVNQNYLGWRKGCEFKKGELVLYEDQIFKALETHVSQEQFEAQYWGRLSHLQPLVSAEDETFFDQETGKQCLQAFIASAINQLPRDNYKLTVVGANIKPIYPGNVILVKLQKGLEKLFVKKIEWIVCASKKLNVQVLEVEPFQEKQTSYRTKKLTDDGFCSLKSCAANHFLLDVQIKNTASEQLKFLLKKNNTNFKTATESCGTEVSIFLHPLEQRAELKRTIQYELSEDK